MLTEEQLKNAIERLLFVPMRLRHRTTARQKYKARTSTIETTRRTLIRATEIKSEKVRWVYNLVLYMLLADQDLADFTESIIYATGDRKRAFFAKHEAVLLYEAAEDLRQMLGREFRTAVKSFGTTDEKFRKVNAACSALNKFWDDRRQLLYSIRKRLGCTQRTRCIALRSIA
jgi:hypothetical protein